MCGVPTPKVHQPDQGRQRIGNHYPIQPGAFSREARTRVGQRLPCGGPLVTVSRPQGDRTVADAVEHSIGVDRWFMNPLALLGRVLHERGRLRSHEA